MELDHPHRWDVIYMARAKIVGITDYLEQLEKIQESSSEAVGKMIFDGAGIVADEVRRRILMIPEREVYETSSGHNHTRGITDVEREGLLDTLGITKMRNDSGFINVAIGFDGYNANVTKSYPNGHPNSMVARTIESGTSWLAKTPFIAPAVQATKGSAVKAMEKVFDNATSGNRYGRYSRR